MIASHENHHEQISQSYLPKMDAAVLTGTCASVSRDLDQLAQQMAVEQCEYDLKEYGYAQRPHAGRVPEQQLAVPRRWRRPCNLESPC